MSSEEDGLGNAGTVSTNEQEHSLGLDLAIVCSDLSSAFTEMAHSEGEPLFTVLPKGWIGTVTLWAPHCLPEI